MKKSMFFVLDAFVSFFREHQSLENSSAELKEFTNGLRSFSDFFENKNILKVFFDNLFDWNFNKVGSERNEMNVPLGVFACAVCLSEHPELWPSKVLKKGFLKLLLWNLRVNLKQGDLETMTDNAMYMHGLKIQKKIDKSTFSKKSGEFVVELGLHGLGEKNCQFLIFWIYHLVMLSRKSLPHFTNPNQG
jgi:hypothetical protein